jgi:hypothetical protein
MFHPRVLDRAHKSFDEGFAAIVGPADVPELIAARYGNMPLQGLRFCCSNCSPTAW